MHKLNDKQIPLYNLPWSEDPTTKTTFQQQLVPHTGQTPSDYIWGLVLSEVRGNIASKLVSSSTGSIV